MARDKAMDDRLWRWAEAMKSGGVVGNGYPVKCTLHEDWSPPSPGMTPTLRTAPPSDAPQTQRLVLMLSDRAKATLAAHYILRMSTKDAADALDCMPDTVLDRIEAAHRTLMQILADDQRVMNGVFATSSD